MLLLLVTYIDRDAVRLLVVILFLRHISHKTSKEEKEKKEDQKRKKEQETLRLRNEEKEGTEFTY
jgi:hypothetical protein